MPVGKRKSRAQREAERAAKESRRLKKTTVSIDEVYAEYKRLHEKLPKSWKKKHWAYDEAPLKYSQQIVHALGKDVEGDRVKIAKYQLNKKIREIVILEHVKNTQRDYNFSKRSDELTLHGLEEIRGDLDYNTYRKFKRRLTETDNERKKLEYGVWLEELYAVLKDKRDPSALGDSFSQIFFGSR